MLINLAASGACIIVIFTSLAIISISGQQQQQQQQQGADISLINGDYDRPGVTAAQVLRARGYLAEEFHFDTRDGYRLNIVRGRNPLINGGRQPEGKDPVLFIHGTIVSASSWVLDSNGARPMDFTRLELTRAEANDNVSVVVERLDQTIGNDPSARSMPLLCLNFGYEVWLLNRRGTLPSEGRATGQQGNRTLLDTITSVWPSLIGGLFPKAINSSSKGAQFTKDGIGFDEQQQQYLFDQLEEYFGSNDEATRTKQAANQNNQLTSEARGLLELLQPYINLPGAFVNYGSHLLQRLISSFDPKYWRYSLDEQADNDISATIDFVLEQTHKAKLITVSHSAGGALLLMKASSTPELADKISKSIFWAPAINLGHKDVVTPLLALSTIIKTYVGPIPLPPMTEPIEALLQIICQSELAQVLLCEGVSDLVLGLSGAQQPVGPSILSDILEPVSSRELIHLAQFSVDKEPRRFRFLTEAENIAHYGEPGEPPLYDVSRIRLKNMHLYTGVSDGLVSPTDVDVTVSQLTVPYKYTVINETGLYFNHAGYFVHKSRARLIMLPTMRDILEDDN